MGLEVEIRRGLGRQEQLIYGPLLALFGLATQRFGSESVECRIVCGMHRHQLSLQMSREFGRLQSVIGQHTAECIAIASAFSGALQIKKTSVPGRNLYPFVAQLSGPRGNVLQRIEGRRVGSELSQKNGRSSECVHRSAPIVLQPRGNLSYWH